MYKLLSGTSTLKILITLFPCPHRSHALAEHYSGRHKIPDLTSSLSPARATDVRDIPCQQLDRSSMSGIAYEPLDRTRREIRLLVLENLSKDKKGKYQAEQPLRCKFLKTSLALHSTRFENHMMAGKPTGLKTLVWGLNQTQKSFRQMAFQKPAAYFALSYAWGDSARVCDIEIDGFPAKIPRNLAEALWSIRANTSMRIIWADALCINQGDDNEKSWQVQEMATIYRRAHTVISWLGPSTPRTELAFSVIKDVQGKEDWSDTAFINTFQARATSSAAFAEDVEQLVKDAERWASVLEILDRPYWTRMWVFQELACAKNRLFLCGDTSMKDIDRTLCRVMRYAQVNGNPSVDLMTTKHSTMIWTTREFEFRSWSSQYQGERPLLLKLLRRLSELEASDGRDLVFALISIVEDRRELGIVPDYSKTIEAVFTETAIALLKQNRFDMLLDAIRLSQRPGLPTWVPDWQAATTPDLKLEASLYRLCGHKIKRQSVNLNFCIPNFSLECYVVDEVMLVGDPYRARADSAATNTQKMKFCSWLESMEIAVWDHSKYIDTQDEDSTTLKQDITVRLLSADTLFDPLAQRIPHNFPRQIISKIYQALRTDSFAVLQRKSASGDLPEAKGYFDAMRQTLLRGSGARPFRTINGYSCLCADEDCKVGDFIVIIPGVEVPLILRRTKVGDISEENPSLMVGVAYVHGIMDGEFFRQKLRERQTVMLC